MSASSRIQKKVLNHQQSLDLIAAICGDDFCEEMSMEDGMGRSAAWSPELRKAMDKLSFVYRIAHCSSESHACFHVHKDWRKEAAESYEAISKAEGL